MSSSILLVYGVLVEGWHCRMIADKRSPLDGAATGFMEFWETARDLMLAGF